GDILTYKGEEVDVIICNPPYFKTKEDNKSNKESLNIAKHEGDLTLENLIPALRRNLKNNGTLFFLYQTSRMQEVISELTSNKFHIKEMQFAYDENKKQSSVFMIKAVKGGKMGVVVKKPYLITRNKDL
ncbi:MAG: hypothetical protein J6W64_04350, partial [Bacilli bacterium]|nr:hypothetical protein [Bacilli bacterium]